MNARELFFHRFGKYGDVWVYNPHAGEVACLNKDGSLHVESQTPEQWQETASIRRPVPYEAVPNAFRLACAERWGYRAKRRHLRKVYR